MKFAVQLCKDPVLNLEMMAGMSGKIASSGILSRKEENSQETKIGC